MSSNLSKIVSQALQNLDVKKREVIEGRYGLKDGAVYTLAEIGARYNVTRERVRQIEEVALGELESAMRKGDAKAFVEMVKLHLKNVGGLRREALLFEDLKKMIADANTPHLANKIRFVLSVYGEPRFFDENEYFYDAWYVTEDDKKNAVTFTTNVIKQMANKKDAVVTHRTIDKVFTAVVAPHNLQDLIALNYISASKQFHVNQYGDFGLSKWPEVNPKTVKDWIYIVLKKNQKPAHFNDIAAFINKVRPQNKVAHPQTVHNELIKDERFILVGRGMYGLREFGLMPGTARQVMSRILKEHGPLSSQELLSLVLKERMFKKNTVLINLQNSKYFKRLDGGTYTAHSV
ncbi:MAG: sigma factor-like helix-turn-helix DNA-binding protein [bacterium]|nr:sigma factor-like helix-turn-helix DNA-binding protein [bacterium]